MRARAMVAVVTAATVVLLTGCDPASGGSDGAGAEPTPTESSLADTSSLDGPTELIGLWRVSDAAGEGPDTWLRLASDEVTLWRECGFVMGDWSAAAGELVAGFFAAHQDCMASEGMPAVDWLEAPLRYERAGDGWVLRDDSGALAARLTIDGAPPRHPDSAPENVEPPQVTADARFRLAAVELPAGTRAADGAELVGRWVPEASAPNDPYLEVRADGTWTGTDGCNGSGGRWTVPRAGALLATSGVMTLVGCEGSNEPLAFASARAVGFDGDVLVMIDAQRTEVARLVRG